ncbi:unnamed protein product [Orchesella dallaii]|uniref:DNA primase n=1 Tax=Orchesella dallaii TaxID=48710 RepID=A0ABP1S592_9HEXA
MGLDKESGGYLIDFLPLYYGRLFPGELMYRWLSYGNRDFFSHREFSFSLQGDVYLRYQSFSSHEHFVEALKHLKPEKIDIGAVYNQKPRTKELWTDLIPLQKEFVLDIDLTDYDDVRSCCQGAKVCEKCWKFIAVAVKIIDASLRDDFGFQHLLWVFSGRRGVHCWVCDETAINLDSHARTAILGYLTVIRGGVNQAKKVKIENVDRLHPFLCRSLDIIDEKFDEICRDDQNMLENGDINFEMLPVEVKTAVRNSNDRFNDLMTYLHDNKKESKTLKRTTLCELKLQLCFPRLDVNVSKELNHLLKSPFCIHPKTEKICVPFDPKKAFEFQPSQVPTITQVLEEINSFDNDKKLQSKSNGKEDESAALEDYKKTSLLPFIKEFENFVKNLEKTRTKISIDEL